MEGTSKKLSAIHRTNKAIEWVLKEKSKEADNAIADKAQPQQSTGEPVSSISKMQNAKAEPDIGFRYVLVKQKMIMSY